MRGRLPVPAACRRRSPRQRRSLALTRRSPPCPVVGCRKSIVVGCDFESGEVDEPLICHWEGFESVAPCRRGQDENAAGWCYDQCQQGTGTLSVRVWTVGLAPGVAAAAGGCCLSEEPLSSDEVNPMADVVVHPFVVESERPADS